jgi:hypothetical protein
VQVTEEEKMWTYYRSNEYVPFLLDFGMHRTLVNNIWSNNTVRTFQLDNKEESPLPIGNSKKKIDFPELLNSPKFESLVAQSASFSKLANSQSISLRNRIVEILEILQAELNQKK